MVRLGVKHGQGWFRARVVAADLRLTMSERTVLSLRLEGGDPPERGWWSAPMPDMGLEEERRQNYRAVLKRTFMAFDVPWSALHALQASKFPVQFIKKETWALRELSSTHTGSKQSRVTCVQADTPLAVQLMQWPHPGNYNLRHIRVPAFEKYVFLPNGKAGVMTMCGDLVPPPSAIAREPGVMARTRPTCFGCRAADDLWQETQHEEIDGPCDCDAHVPRSPDEYVHLPTCASLRRVSRPRLLTLESWLAFMAKHKLKGFMPLDEAVSS